MRSRFLVLLMALVVGLFAGWPAVASPVPLPAPLAAAAVQEGTQAAIQVAYQAAAEAATQTDGAPIPADHRAPDHLGELWAELSGSPAFAEGAPDLPALFLAGAGAHAPSATMAPPRPHAAESWQRLYLNVPLRPPRAPRATA